MITGTKMTMPDHWWTTHAGELNEAPGWHDLAIAELPSHYDGVLDVLDNPWFSSWAFSSGYASPPATRVLLRLDEAGQPITAIWYYEQSWLGIGKCLHLFGPLCLAQETLLRLLQARDAQWATIHRYRASEIVENRAPWHRGTVKQVVEDFVIDLPDTPAAYLASLGSRTRQQIPQHMRRLQREWGDELQIRYLVDKEIMRERFAELVALNRARREAKGARYLWTSELLEQRWRLARRQGVLCEIRRGATLVSGTLTYLHRGHAYTAVLGHDMAFEKLHVGKIGLWLTIEQMIKRGIQRHHLLWGWSPYKVRFGAVEERLYDVTIFRHPAVAVIWHLAWLLTNLLPMLKTVLCQWIGSERVRQIYGGMGRLRIRICPLRGGACADDREDHDVSAR